MKSEQNDELYKLKAELCKTFSDPKRLKIINSLRDAEKSVGELTEALNMPQAIVSRQLSILRTRGVVESRRSGTTIFYRLTDRRICEACDIVHEILLRHLDNNQNIARNILT
jgi:DNA-binding transcriptional ArsR family regulator